MIFSKGKKKISAGILVIICFLSFSNTAHASFISDVRSGTIDLIRFVGNIPFFQNMRNDFCSQYFISIKDNTWKVGEFRVSLGAGLCSGYKNPPVVTTTTTSTTTKTTATSTKKISIPNAIPTTSTNKTSIPTVTVKKINEIIPTTVPNKVSPIPAINTLPGTLIDTSANDGNLLNNSEIVYWTNIERSKNDTTLVPLNGNSILDKIASERVGDMFLNSYFEHVSPTGDNVSKNAARLGYGYITIGENIAFGNFGSSRELVVAWMNSPGHRANILNKNYTQIGVAAKEGLFKGQKVWIAAQIFGRPLSDCKKPDESIKTSIIEYTNYANTLNATLQKIKSEMSGASTQIYNQKVAEYNSVAQTFNDLITKIKNITIDYNKAIENFNTCIKSV